MSHTRENWSSKIGVILAVAGSAVGLGNFLRFPVQAATHGGGSFIIPYIISFLILGIPLAWIEWTLGRYAGILRHGTSPGAYDKIIDKPWGKYLGSLGILPPLFISFYYIFIESWILAFVWYSFTGKLTEVVNAGQISEFFGNYIMLKECFGSVPVALIFFGITFVCNMSLLMFGVRKGIEKVNKIVMPLLLLMGIALVIRVLTIDGISPGLGYMWNPNFNALTDPAVWLAAAGQVFFTMSLGMGIVLCYASYVKRNEDICLSSLTAGATNCFAEIILGGTIVIPLAVIVAGSNIEECAKLGTFGLAFQSMPHVFTKIPLGDFFQTLWFSMLFFAGITSSISIIQPLISFCEDDLKFSRKKSVSTIGVITLIGGLVTIFGLAAGAVDELDFWGGNFLLVLLGTIQAFIFAFVFGRQKVQTADGKTDSLAFVLLNEGSAIQFPKFFQKFMRLVIMYICPFSLLVLLIAWSIHDGADVLLLRNIPEGATVQFMSFQLLQTHFILGLRITLILLVVALNFVIYYAWKSGRATQGRNENIRQVHLGNAESND